MTVLYADVLFLVNMSMDYLTLYVTAKITNGKSSVGRLCAASAIGAVYGVISVIFFDNRIMSTFGTFAVSAIMTWIAFGKMKSLTAVVRQCVLVWGCGTLLGGIMSSLMSMGTPLFHDSDSSSAFSVYFVLTFCLAMLFIRFVFFRRDRKNARVVLEVNGETIAFTALTDSGNLVRDPLSGYPVVITSPHVLGRLTDEIIGFSKINSSNADGIAQKMSVKLRVIPHKTISSEGILYGFLPDRITVDGKIKSAVVALDVKGKEKGYAGFDGIVPMSLCE